MPKRERIWAKADERKSCNLSIRMTPTQAAEIAQKAEQAGLNRNEFICAILCGKQVVVIPEGKEILQAVREIRNILQTFSNTDIAADVEALIREIIIQLRNTLSQR